MNQKKQIESNEIKRDKVNEKADKLLFFASTAMTINLFAIAILHGSIFTIDRTDPLVLVIAVIYLIISIVTLILCILYYVQLKKLGSEGNPYLLGAGISMVIFAVIIFPLNLVFMVFALLAFIKVHRQKTEDRYIELLKEREKSKENNSSND